jgi:tetratricopeptide (TPR) repeat protein
MFKKELYKSSTFILIFSIFSFTFFSFQGLTYAQDRESRELKVLGDTLFQSMSIEELKNIQSEYQKRINRINDEEGKTRDRGLEVTEEFLEREGGNIKDQDKILIRLAEYYYDEAEDEYLAQYEGYETLHSKYLEELDLYFEGQLETEPVEPPQPKYDYSKVIGVYEKILNEYPNSDFADDALYTKAYLMQQMDQGVESRKIYQEVIDRYPESHFAADSYMRLAEYYFDPREDKDTEQTIVELHRAIRLYKKVLQYRDSKRYDEALYKLGWSYYRLSATDPAYYSDAIIYFLAVVDDITRAEDLDPKNKASNPNVKDEAIQYIGISFSDDETYAYAGVSNARRFIENIGGREYGVEIMRSLGQTYQTTERYNEAIDSYSALLDMYPLYEEAPLIKQNVSETWYNLGDDSAAYRARDELFRDYNPKSDWYANLEASDIPDRLTHLKQGHKLSEKALQTNITLDFLRAQELDESNLPSMSMYKRVAKQCEDYLDVFPTDSNAYSVNWNYAQILDLKLNRFEEAYEQYIHVSNDYLETDFQQDAANNAIFVADTLVKLVFQGETDTALAASGIEISSVADEEALRPEVLTNEEKRLIEAYDNYIRLFPEDESTPKYLANAGAIYFNHKQFAEARVYFKTLVNRFPGAKEKTLAYRSIMDSYFYLGQFEDSEFIAKRILQSENLPDEERIFAQKRLAASIFNHAKLFEDQGQFMDAANEFRRVFIESPEDTVYAEAGLFNSGRNYDKIKEWEKALDTYLLLADQYPESKYAISSLVNAAEDNKELKRFSDAAGIYERIYSRQIDNPEEAETALYNAAYYYQEGEDWNNAIRLNNKYIATYPDNPLSTDFYFATAGFYLKLDNLTEANRIYAEFATKYPDDPRGVQAFYERGSYYQDNGQLTLAKAEYQKAIDKSEGLNRKGLDPNRYYVGESLNKMVDMLYNEYNDIQLTQPANNIEAQQARMRSLIKDISANDLKIIANGSIRSFEAAYRNAEVYEIFADKYVNQERNPNLNADQRFIEDRKIRDASAGLYDKAVDEYIKAMENIPIIAEKLDTDLFAEEDTVVAEAVLDTTFDDTTGMVARAEVVDSTKETGLKWYNKATSKISYLYYKEANITKENVNEALRTPNPQTDPYMSILFQARVITELINPSVEQTISAHQKNIDEAAALGLSNKYVEESRRQIMLTSNVPPEQVEKLAFLALRDYKEQMNEYRRLVEMEYGTVNTQGKDYMAIKDEVQLLIDISKNLAISALDNYRNSLDRASEYGIENDLIRTTENNMMRIAVELTDLYETYHDSALVFQDYYQMRFDSTENYNYDDAFLFYQDQTFSFSEYGLEILDHAFQLKEEYEISNLWASKILGKLIALDPATYAGAIEREKVVIESDGSWLVSKDYTPGYIQENFDDSGWKNAGIVTSDYNQFIDLGVDPKPMWYPTKPAVIDTSQISPFDTTFGMSDSLSGIDSLGLAVTDTTADQMAPIAETTIDTSAFADTGIDSLSSDTTQVYFRKVITLNGTPVDGYIYITADDDFNFFLNEEYITDDEDDNFAIIDTVDFGYMSYSVKQGANILAIRVTDTDNSARGVKLYGYFELIPMDITAAVTANSQVAALDIDPVILKRINTLNKNRITVR